MRLEKCPRCNDPITKTDVVCVGCGLDLVEAEKKLTNQVAEAASVGKRPQVGKPGAASGQATDVGQDTRLHVYDEFHSEELQKEKSGAVASAVIAWVAGIVFVGVALTFLGKAGGIAGMIHSVTPATMREKGFGIFDDSGVLAAVAFGMGIAGILVGIGQTQRVKLVRDAIEDVRFGGRPTVVGIPSWTAAGLIIAGFVVPPLGIIVGIILKLSKDPDTRDLGTRVLMAGGAAIALFVVNELWGMAAQLKEVAPKDRVVPGG
jgi:hypothetical protein